MPATAVHLQLPAELEALRAEVERALGQPDPAIWPDDVRFLDADSPAAISRVLVRAVHPHLAEARIRHLFRETMVKGERTVLGKAKRAGAQLAYLAELDFVLEFNWRAWGTLTVEQRLALVDHELCHCGQDSEHDRWVTLPHDIEEFGAIVRRWGAWDQGLRLFRRDLQESQLELELPIAPSSSILDAVASLAPEPGSGIAEVTFGAGDKSVTLTQADGARLRDRLSVSRGTKPSRKGR